MSNILQILGEFAGYRLNLSLLPQSYPNTDADMKITQLDLVAACDWVKLAFIDLKSRSSTCKKMRGGGVEGTINMS